MKPTIKYHPEDTCGLPPLVPAKILESEEVGPGIVFDYDEHGRVVGIELLDAKVQLSPELLTDVA